MPFCFMDFETQSNADLSVTGTLKYVLDPSTRPLLNSWAIDNGPVQLWCPDLSVELALEVWFYVRGRMAVVSTPPPDIVRVLSKPDGYLVAHNMAFDRAVWQQIATPDYGWPRIEIEQTLCSMAQSQASNLPGQLDWAGRMLGLGQKTLGGKAIMLRFAQRQQPLPGARVLIDVAPDRPAALKAAIEMWALYLDYSVQDTELMRAVWQTTRPLDAEEWAVYWTSERINDRGIPVDLDVCRGAVAYREEEALHVETECKRLTENAISAPTLTKQINEWLYDRLPDDLAETMVKARDDEGYVTRLTGAKDVMGRLIEDIKVSDTPPADDVVEFVELLQFGRASSAVKFEKMINQEVDGRVHGQFVFNGARHRFSSRGIQLHNLPRAYLDNELDVLDLVAAKAPIEKLREVGPISAVLAKLIRPTIVAPPGRVFVWADYSAVEARVNPWLANSRDADEAVLEPFRRMDADKTKSTPDIYVINAAVVFNIPVDVLWERYKNGDPEAKAMRQAGKVMVLALGFLGSVGALKAMARGYGIRLTDEEAKVWVDGWRDRNRWARRFGDKVQEAMFSAMARPMTTYKAGRVGYIFAPDLMGGTLVAMLPDGRPITYPMAKIEKREKFGKEQDTIVYLDGMARMSMWAGLAIENCLAGDTQVLTRRGIVRLDTVQSTDLLWDGIDWVSHSKLLVKGVQPIIDRWGVSLTPNHLVLTNDGWKEAKDCTRSDRANVWLPDDAASIRSVSRPRPESYLVGTVRLRERVGSAYRWFQKQSKTIAYELRMQNFRVTWESRADTRYVASQGFRCLAVDGGPMHATDTSSLAQLRWSGDHSVQVLGCFFSSVLGRHGADVQRRTNDRSRKEQRGVLPRELSLGNAQGSSQKSTPQSGNRYPVGAYAGVRSIGFDWHRCNDLAVSVKERLADVGVISSARNTNSLELVYDLMDCGPRNRFTVFDSSGVPFLVHNCTQFTAAGLLRESLVRIDREETEGEIIGHTHDEILMEVDEDKAADVVKRLVAKMTSGFAWADGLPLAAEPAMSYYYSKNERETAVHF